MISDSPPDRELEWTDEGIQSSKNLVHRIERYFLQKRTDVNFETEKKVERFVNDIEKNILDFSLNKCVADIYTLFNYLEKNQIYLHDNELSRKVLICLFPILPRLSVKISSILFNTKNLGNWPDIKYELLVENKINLPIQIQGKLVTTFETMKGYKEKDILNSIYQLDKIKNKIANKEVLRVINVQDKIINIITK